MKTLLKICFAILTGMIFSQPAAAQTRAQRKAAAQAKITDLMNLREYVFKADYVMPFRGGGDRALTSDYDLTVSRDSVIAYLPYFGRAYLADYGSTDGGIKNVLTNFDYKVTTTKKGNREILITPKNASLSDPKAVQYMRLDVSPDGYASLQVISLNRDPISFNGTIDERVKAKTM